MLHFLADFFPRDLKRQCSSMCTLYIPNQSLWGWEGVGGIEYVFDREKKPFLQGRSLQVVKAKNSI